MHFLSTDGRFSHLGEYICEDHVSFVLMAVVYCLLFCQMSVYFKGVRWVVKDTWWRTTKSEQNQGGAWKILRLLDLQVRVHDMHLATPLLLSNPLPPPPKKGRIVLLQISDRYPFKRNNLVSRGCVATEAGRPRIQRFAGQLILALDVNDLGHLAFRVCQANKMNSCVHIPFLLLTSLFAPQSYATQVCCNWKNSYWFGLSANKSLTWLMKCSGMWTHSKLGDYKVMSGIYPANSSAAVKSRSGYFYSVVESET